MSESKPHGEIDELLDRAYQALIAGDRSTADVLAGQVLAIDRDNAEAEDLLAAPTEQGQIRRLTILFADLVESTALSTRVEPETYRIVVGRYREEVRRLVDHYGGHIASIKGDGLLAVFGHPDPHEDDARRAVQAGLEITEEVAKLNEQTQRRFGIGIQVRIGVNRGLVYLDTAQDDVYGFAANLASRLCGLAEPGTVVVSDGIARLTRGVFELQARPAKPVKGVQGVVEHYRAVSERATRRTPLGPLVDRLHEMAYLDAAWAQAQVGTLTTPGVGFFGGPGIGKSRLASEAIAMAGRSDAAVVELIGSPFHNDVGLHPVRRLLESRCQIDRNCEPAEMVRRLEAEVAKCSLSPSTMVPLLAPVLGISPRSGYESVQAEGRKLHEQINAAVREYLLAPLREGPELIVVEDMQWFDEDTVELVRSVLAEDIGGLLVIMLSREEASLPNCPGAQVFELKPLTGDEADELILALHPGIAAGAREAVNERCEGVPLYIEEVVTKIREQPSDALVATRVPDTLYEALLSKFSSSTAAAQVVEAAATIGSRVDRQLLLSVVDLTEANVDQVMRELIGGRVFEALDEDGWRFRHELYREVAAERAPPSRRRRLHSRVADALVAAAGGANPDWPLVAHHYEHADRFDEAASAYQQATSSARRRGALGEARAYLTSALAQIERLPSGEPRNQREITLRLRRGFLAYAAEGTSSRQAAADFEHCLQLSGTHQSRQLYMTLSALYGYYATRANLDRAQQILESTQTAFAAGWERLRPENTAGFGMVAWYRGEFDSARDKLELAGAARNDAAEEFDAIWFMPNEAVASIFTHLALARFIQGDLAGAEAELAKTRRRCEKLGFPQGPYSLAYAHWMEIWISREAGQLDRAAKVADHLALNGQRSGFDLWTLTGQTERAVVSAVSSLAARVVDPDVLEGHVATVTEFVDTLRALEVKALTTRYDGVIARLLVAGGRFAEARDRVNVGLRLAEETGMRFYDAELLRIRARTHEDPTERRADLRSAVELARLQGATIFELRAAAEYFNLDGEAARQALTDALRRFSNDSTWPELTQARLLLDRDA
ncbi:adenylate/guanylate cyclase domain-containing protein [Mycolicibacterium celeriflavum]|uniref:adenylate/guanylate cyclase domain-containing protein n=1 Tax=Mycolicibacterium celeriflavum TaxID=1249101 RepID=UPI003CF7D983